MKFKILILGAICLLVFTFLYLQNSFCYIHIEEFTSREKPEYYVFEGMNQKGIILNAINEIKKNSKRDYDMVCKYGNKILVRPDEIVLKKCSLVPGTPSPACYDPAEKAIYLSYHLLLNSERLPFILVHESCHGMELGTMGHTSESSCIKMETLYKASSEKKSFYCTKEVAASSYSPNEGYTWRKLRVMCAFINDENRDRTICVVVYLKDGEKVVDLTKVCSHTPAGKISEKEFYIIGNGTKDSLEYREVTEDTEISTLSTIKVIPVIPTVSDVSECEEINNQWDSDMCYYTVAKIQGDLTICEKISDQNLIYCCEATTKKDLDICEKIENQSWKEFCCREWQRWF